MQSKLTITPKSPIRTAHANLPMFCEETFASDLETRFSETKVSPQDIYDLSGCKIDPFLAFVTDAWYYVNPV